MKKHLVLSTISFLFASSFANALEEVHVIGYPGGVGVASLSWYVYFGTQFSVGNLSKGYDEKTLTEEQKQKNRCTQAIKAIDNQKDLCKVDAQKSFDNAYSQQCVGLTQSTVIHAQVGANIHTGGASASITQTYNPQASCVQRISINKETSMSQCDLNAKLAINSLNCPAQ